MSDVYLIKATSADPPHLTDEKVSALFDAAGFSKIFRKGEISALKLHVGEPGTRTFIRPSIVKSVVACMKRSGAAPFLTDTSVLYKSPRGNGVSHVEVAMKHGFTFEAVDAPFIPADGILGKDETMVPVYGKHFEEVSIASAIAQARSMLVLTHVTGHLGTGFGGTLKNLGMGCSSKKAKLSQHYGQQPRIKPSACTACGTCAVHCPSDAITVSDTAVIDPDLCIGCGECIAVCEDEAVTFNWTLGGRELEERIVEHAVAVHRTLAGRIGYLASAQDITKDCDCLGVNQQPLLDDIGFLASWDPVAIDKAVHDLIVERSGRTLESMSYPRLDGTIQLHYGEKIGLGSVEYKLIEVAL